MHNPNAAIRLKWKASSAPATHLMREIFSYLSTPIFVITRFTLGLMWGNTVTLSPHRRHWLNNSRHSPLSLSVCHWNNCCQGLARRNRHLSNLDWSVTMEDWKCVRMWPPTTSVSFHDPKWVFSPKYPFTTLPYSKEVLSVGFCCVCEGSCRGEYYGLFKEGPHQGEFSS